MIVPAFISWRTGSFGTHRYQKALEQSEFRFGMVMFNSSSPRQGVKLVVVPPVNSFAFLISIQPISWLAFVMRNSNDTNMIGFNGVYD